MSRTKSSARNALTGVVTQVLTLILSFASRTVFIGTLGVELLGINSLLVSILAMLAVADLGISGALMYALYPALASGDTQKIAQITRFAARVYRWVALFVAVSGISLLPFIDRFVSKVEPPEQLGLFYLILLSNTVAGYLVQYRIILLEADQKLYVAKIYAFIFGTARSLAQIAILVLFQSFIAYLAAQTIFTVANNLALFRHIGRRYPYLTEPAPALDIVSKRDIVQSVRALLIYRVGGLVLNNSDPILISVIVGTVALGYYANYSLIVGALVMVTEVAFASFTSSVGNLMASSDRAGARRVLQEMSLLSIGVHGLVAVFLILSLDDIIGIWLGDAFRLGDTVVLVVALNFYAAGIMAPIWSFRIATGMFRRTRYVFLFTAALNIALSIILGELYGLWGILLATLLARIVTSMWYEPLILFKEHLDGGLARYWAVHIVAILVLTSAVVVGSLLPLPEGLASVIIRTWTGGAIATSFLWWLYRRTEEGRALTARARTVLGRLR